MHVSYQKSVTFFECFLGFDKSEANPDGMFGGGFYFTDVSSKANQYVIAGKPCPNHNNISCYMCPRKMLLCRVILGK